MWLTSGTTAVSMRRASHLPIGDTPLSFFLVGATTDWSFVLSNQLEGDLELRSNAKSQDLARFAPGSPMRDGSGIIGQNRKLWSKDRKNGRWMQVGFPKLTEFAVSCYSAAGLVSSDLWFGRSLPTLGPALTGLMHGMGENCYLTDHLANNLDAGEDRDDASFLGLAGLGRENAAIKEGQFLWNRASRRGSFAIIVSLIAAGAIGPVPWLRLWMMNQHPLRSLPH